MRYECGVCCRTFSNVYNLKVHTRDQHCGLGSVKCDICGLYFKNLSTVRVHKSNYHRNQFVGSTSPGLLQRTESASVDEQHQHTLTAS